MWDAIGHSTVALIFAVVILLNAGCVLMVAFQLPGTWLMLALTAAVAWWRWGQGTIGIETLVTMSFLAVIGEVIETVGGSAAAGKAGASKRGMLGALVGAVFGAICGTLFIPIPVAGTLMGACLGSGAGAITGDRWAGRPWAGAWNAGRAATVGRFRATLGKLAVAVVMWLVATVAIAWH